MHRPVGVDVTLDLRDLDGVRAFLASTDPDGELVPLGVDRVEIAPDALRAVPEVVGTALDRAARPRTGAPARVVVLTDATPILRDGVAIKQDVVDRLSAQHDVEHVVLDDGHATLHADDRALATATAAVAGADCVVAIGSGTITDIGKVATSASPDVPLVIVQTAASVDAFTDDVSVVLRQGVKRTIPARWPTVLVADLTTIGGAPDQMNRAGLGEALSMFTAAADWYLASLVDLDERYHPGPRRLLATAAGDPADLVAWSRGLPQGDPVAVERLVEFLAVRGIATGVAGTTACLSGAEHLFSHMLDMHHGHEGRPIGLHGAQVGVGSVIGATAWEVLFEVAPTATLAIPDDATARALVERAFGHLDADGHAVEECWTGLGRKLAAARERVDLFAGLLDEWSTHAPELRRAVSPPQPLAEALAASGAATTLDQLDPVIAPDLARWAVANAHLMRDRFTVIDLLWFLGAWTDDVVERLVSAVRTPSTTFTGS